MIKVHQGTRSEAPGQSLCHTCRNATVLKGAAESQEFIRCHQAEVNVTKLFPVVECTSYVNRASTSLHDLYEVAWILEPSKKVSGQIGFKPYREWRKEHAHEAVLPEAAPW